jgi:hypothetical protein
MKDTVQRKGRGVITQSRARAPVRDSVLNVRLSQAERERLERFAVEHDLRVAQAVRLLLREHTPATAGSPTDGEK